MENGVDESGCHGGSANVERGIWLMRQEWNRREGKKAHNPKPKGGGWAEWCQEGLTVR